MRRLLIGIALATIPSYAELPVGYATNVTQAVYNGDHWSCTDSAAPPSVRDNTVAACVVPARPGYMHVLKYITFSMSQHPAPGSDGIVTSISNSVRVYDGDLPPVSNMLDGVVLRWQCPVMAVWADVNPDGTQGDGGVLFCEKGYNPDFFGTPGKSLSACWAYYADNTIQTISIVGVDIPVPHVQ